jgi:hypothetical protein
MAANTSKGITYPTSGDAITPLETVFATMASTTNTALGAINAGTDITTGTLPITRGGTGGTTQATAAAALGVVPLANYNVAGKNAIINGAFDVWQRSTGSNTTTLTGYFADRWRYTATGGTSKVLSQSREAFSPGTAPAAGYESKSFLRVSVPATPGSGYTFEAVEQPIEDVRTFAGTTVTVSFWAKTTSSTLNFTPRLTQFFGTAGSADVVTLGTSIAVTTSWTRFTQTLTVPSVAGKTLVDTNSALIFSIVPNTFNSIYTLDLWGVQIEQGSIATNFNTAADTIAGEIALCQRYYYRTTNLLTGTVPFASGMQFSTTIAWAYLKFPQKMRAAPTALESSAASTIQMVCTAGVSSTAVAFGSANDDGGYISITVAGTAGQGGIARFTGTVGTAFLGFSAEI